MCVCVCDAHKRPDPALTPSLDGSGAIDFEEFFAWLNAPATYAKSNAKLEALRAQATLRQVKAKSKAVATSLGAAARAAILAPPKSTKVHTAITQTQTHGCRCRYRPRHNTYAHTAC